MPLVVSYTLQPVTVADITQVVIRPGNIAGEIVATSYFAVKDADGIVRENDSSSVNLAGAANADLLATIKGIVRPTANGTLIVRQATEIAASAVTVMAGSCGTLLDYGV